MTPLRRPTALRPLNGQFTNSSTAYAWLCDDAGCLILSKIPNTVRLETTVINNQACVALKDVYYLLKTN